MMYVVVKCLRNWKKLELNLEELEMKENKMKKLRNRLFVFRNQLHKIKINEKKNDYNNNQTSQYYKKKPMSHFIHEREEWSTIQSIASDQHWRRRRRWPLAVGESDESSVVADDDC
jgi:hypothetical protein